jgi:hypothetical protein
MLAATSGEGKAHASGPKNSGAWRRKMTVSMMPGGGVAWEEAAVAHGPKACINCGRPLADRVEEEVRTGGPRDQSTGQCSTYRVWFCVNTECVMYKTDVYREQYAE